MPDCPTKLIGQFVEHFVRMQFDKAREFAEAEKIRIDWNVDFLPLDRKLWSQMMTSLAQLANLESVYFSFSFLLSKFSFRKENNLKDVYGQLRNEFNQIAVEQQNLDKQSSVVVRTANKFALFASIRANLVGFYIQLASKGWSTFEDLQQLVDFKSSIENQDDGDEQNKLLMPCRNELCALRLLRSAQQAMQECNNSSTVNFLQLFQTFARKSNAHTICLLLNRIAQDGSFQGFGYHYNSNINFKNGEEVPSNFTAPTSNGERSVNAIKHVQPSTGTGQLPSRRDFQSGLFDKYPALFFIPTERRHDPSLYATICSFIQEGCCNEAGNSSGIGIVTSNSNANLAAESSGTGKIRYLYDKSKEQTFFTACVEGNIHLVVTFERRVQERESVVNTFFNDALGGLRCTKLFQEIRSMGK